MYYGHCEKCWNNPCNCGYEYRHMNVEQFAEYIRDIMIYKTIVERLEIISLVKEYVDEAHDLIMSKIELPNLD